MLCFCLRMSAMKGAYVLERAISLNKKAHVGADAMKMLGILLLMLSVVFGIVAAQAAPVPVLIEHRLQNFHEIIQTRIFYSALSGISLLAGIVLISVSIAMGQIMKQNQDIHAAIKQLATSVVYMRLVDRRQAERRQHDLPVEEEKRQSDYIQGRRSGEDRREGG